MLHPVRKVHALRRPAHASSHCTLLVLMCALQFAICDVIRYENMVRVSSKVGMLQKQGGSNTKKWDARQVLIADSFFAQYVATVLHR